MCLCVCVGGGGGRGGAYIRGHLKSLKSHVVFFCLKIDGALTGGLISG